MSSKINLITRLQHWMDSVPGQTFLNYAYSWGASIVILGALFKLTHLPGGNLMLFAGMGTEVFVFFLSAFDRPFDKTEIGKELPHDYQTDEEIAATLAAQEKGYAPETEEKETPDAIPSTAQAVVFTAPSGVSAPAYVAPAPQAAAPQPQAAPTETAQTPAPSAQLPRRPHKARSKFHATPTQSNWLPLFVRPTTNCSIALRPCFHPRWRRRRRLISKNYKR